MRDITDSESVFTVIRTHKRSTYVPKAGTGNNERPYFLLMNQLIYRLIVAGQMLGGFFFPGSQCEGWKTAHPQREGLIFSLKACQQGSVPGTLVNYVNTLIPFHFPTYQLPFRE